MKSSSNLLLRTVLAFLGLGAAATALAFTFTLNSGTGLPVKWPAKPIPLIIMLGDTATLSDGSNFNTSARTAANTWNTVIGSAQLQTTLVAAGSATDDNDRNEMGFAATVFDRSFGNGVLAVTTGFSRSNERTEADVIFNSARTWDSYRGPLNGNTIDLQRVAIHELGHLLGLDHPDEASQSVNAIMNSRVSSTDTLTSDDIEGAQSLYGPPGVPPNNAFADATVLASSTSAPITVKGYNTNATKETGEPVHDTVNPNSPGGRSVWWRWTAPATGNVTIDTRGSFFDTTLAIYTGTTLSGLTARGSSDDIDPGRIQASLLTLDVTSGTTYLIAVDGFNNDDGNGADNGGITLNVTYKTTGIAPPGIATQPASVTVNSGGSASFSVVATGSDPLSYQWLFNTNPITGATNASLSLTSVTSAQAGTYTVTVTNAAGSVTSTGAILTVNTPAPPAPPPSSGGGGGGGGAPSLWFCTVLAALGLARVLRHARP